MLLSGGRSSSIRISRAVISSTLPWKWTQAKRAGRWRDCSKIRTNPGERRAFTGLVQVLRVVGCSGTPSRRTSGRRSWIQRSNERSPYIVSRRGIRGDHETYGGRASYYLDAAAWAALGGETVPVRCCGTPRAMPLSELMKSLMGSCWPFSKARFDDALRCMEGMRIPQEPELIFTLARHYSYIGSPGSAIKALKRAAQAGFMFAQICCDQTPGLAARGLTQSLGLC